MTAAALALVFLAGCLALFFLGIKRDVESAPADRPAGSLAPRAPEDAPKGPAEERPPEKQAPAPATHRRSRKDGDRGR